jgi:hypothetical protein
MDDFVSINDQIFDYGQVRQRVDDHFPFYFPIAGKAGGFVYHDRTLSALHLTAGEPKTQARIIILIHSYENAQHGFTRVTVNLKRIILRLFI